MAGEDGNEVFLDRYVGDGISIGNVWEKWLHERLRPADAVVCVLTAYVASTWCTAEMVIAQSRGSRLLPIHADQVSGHPLLTSCRRSPSDSRARSEGRGTRVRPGDFTGAKDQWQ